MSKKSWLMYMTMLLGPALAIGIGALVLLDRERDRWGDQLRRDAAFRAVVMAENLSAALAGQREPLLDHLRGLAGADLGSELARWEAREPLVRNLFVWQRNSGLLYPAPEPSTKTPGFADWRPASREQQRFMQRYDSLFSGIRDWDVVGGGESQSLTSASLLPSQNLKSLDDGQDRRGWKFWYWEDRPYLLGWIQLPHNDLVLGVEVEFVYLLSRVLPAFKSSDYAGHGFALVDASGQIVHAVGNLGEDVAKPDVFVPVGEQLPNWQVGVFLEPTGSQPGRAFFWTALVVVLLLVGATVTGGLALIRQTQRGMLETRQKSNFVSNVSHELRSPLTTIRMYTEMLAEGRVTKEARRRHYLEVVVDESRRLSRLVDNVLTFSRLERGKQRYQTHRVDIAETLERQLDTQLPRLDQAGIPVALHLEPCWVRVDVDALEQVFLNLIDNAAKYGPLPEQERQNRIDIRLKKGRDRLEIWVEDRGRGIDPGNREKIFENYFMIEIYPL